MRKLSKILATFMCLCIPFSMFAVSGCNKDEQLKDYDVEPIVTVEGGQIEGEYVNKGTDVRERTYEDVLVFKGIPYAAPPTGQNRWRAPQDVEPWDGVKQCKKFGANPYQVKNELQPGTPDYEGLIQNEYGFSEDCLTLNVWTNGKPRKGGMPVVFYIYGGAWTAGGTTVKAYNGEYLASQEVVFVSVNYRLNMFGWFASSELAEEDVDGSTGNYGFMDLVKALEWCRDNIESFGGDPNKITLFGASAGGNLINALMVSPKAQGLFKRAYSMSYPPDIIKETYPDVKERKAIGDKLIEENGGLDKMRSMSDKEIFDLFLYGSIGIKFSAPCQDGAYLDKGLIPGLKEGRNKNVDYIVGVDCDPDKLLGDDGTCYDDTQFVGWFGKGFDKMKSVDVLMVGVNGFAKLRKIGGAENTYLMQYRHHTPGPVDKGAYHGADANYQLNYFATDRKDYWKDDDFEMGEIISSYFINFVKTGNPNGKTPAGAELIKWEKSNADYKYFAIDNVCKMEETTNVGNIAANFLRLGYDFF